MMRWPFRKKEERAGYVLVPYPHLEDIALTVYQFGKRRFVVLPVSQLDERRDHEFVQLAFGWNLPRVPPLTTRPSSGRMERIRSRVRAIRTQPQPLAAVHVL